jgi:hypothetical protein
MPAPAPTQSASGYIPEIEQALLAFRAALIRCLRAVAVEPASGSAIANRLGLNRHLAWQIATLAEQSSPGPALSALPGVKGLELFLEAAAKAGAGGAELNPLKQALAELEQHISRHAGDRANLALLATAWSEDPSSVPSETLRREGQRAQAALLGSKVKTQVRGVIFGPSRQGSPKHVSMATYQTFDGLVRLRRGQHSRLFYEEAAVHDDGSAAMNPAHFEEHMRSKYKLLAAMSSGPESQIEVHVEGRRGWVTLGPGALGNQAQGTWSFTGTPRYEPPRYRSEQDQLNQIGILSYLPTETLLLDFLFERSIAAESDLDAISAWCFDGSTGYPRRPALPNDPAFLFALPNKRPLSHGSLLADPAYARSAELAAAGAAQLGLRLEDLVGVRFQLAYLMAPSCLVLTRPLTRPPGA